MPYLHSASWSQIDKRTKDLHIYGPPGIQEFIDRLLGIFGVKELSRGFELKIHEINEGEFTIAGKKFTAIDLHHSYGIRFDEYAIAGDANVNDSLISLLKGAALGIFDAGHITNEEVCDVAVRTQVRRLVCSHQYRELDEAALNTVARRQGFTGKIIVAHDLMKL